MAEPANPTPEERAAALWKRLGGDICLDGNWVTDDALVREFAAAIRAAVAEERVACAKLAQEWVTDWNPKEWLLQTDQIAAAIRAMGSNGPR